MVVGDDVCIAVLWLVDLQVGVFPGELLARINGLDGKERRGGQTYRERELLQSNFTHNISNTVRRPVKSLL